MLVGSRCLFRRCPFAGAQLQVPCHRSSAECLQLWFSSEAALALRCWHFGAGHRSQSRSLHGLPVYIGAPASSIFSMTLRCSAPASSISATAAPQASNIFPMALRHGAPASNKPHSAERSTPVWLAIWRIWTGFANSQLRCANFSALIYIYASIPIAATLESLLRQTQIFRPICTDCLRHLRISAG